MPRYGYVLKAPRDFHSCYGFGFLLYIKVSYYSIIRPEGKVINILSMNIAGLWT